MQGVPTAWIDSSRVGIARAGRLQISRFNNRTLTLRSMASFTPCQLRSLDSLLERHNPATTTRSSNNAWKAITSTISSGDPRMPSPHPSRSGPSARPPTRFICLSEITVVLVPTYPRSQRPQINGKNSHSLSQVTRQVRGPVIVISDAALPSHL